MFAFSYKKLNKKLKNFSKKESVLLENKIWRTLRENYNIENRPL